MPPRRLWDLYSNRVVPQWIAPESRWKAPWAISHAWMNIKDRIDDTDLDLVRIEMLNLGAEYVWLDVLCLRQKGGRGEDIRGEEWRLDVPTIGHTCYFSGLGRPLSFTVTDFEGDRCCGSLAGIWAGEKDLKEDVLVIFQEHLTSLEDIMPITGAQCTDNLFAVLMHMQKRVSENPVDKVAGLGMLPAYYEMQSLEDAWTALVNVMRGEYRGQMLLWYPEPGKGRRKWRPSWEQIMTELLPIYDSPLREDVHRDEETDTDWYEGVNIEKGYVCGLAKGSMERSVRRGELVVEDSAGMVHTFEVVATHQYPIPEDIYTLISGSWELGYWIIGRRMPDQSFTKVSTLRMSEQTERIQRLARLGVGKWSRNCLS
ncbi:hypothetical protein IW261DRAFT_1487664 [Armillaria novae-zelandiae]|uniref:Heterokaryon incompatibility domain-containing protein n=1 Tax=Armillaria novae-zelandiae TaxID=153914 RepID=A0AA39P520_9AGAR|nr:hypothetical protein IW261DRAFT_1487664 [Armillaria novae-zelandiae]